MLSINYTANMFVLFVSVVIGNLFRENKIPQSLFAFISTGNDSLYYNPLFIGSPDIADITVFFADDACYYMYGTGIITKQYLYKSKNLVNWECTYINPIPISVQHQIQDIKQPIDVENPRFRANNQIWAPHIVKVGSKYNLYASIAAYGGIICLQSNSPIGPFSFPHYDTIGNVQKLIDLDDVGIPYDVIDPFFVYDHQSGKNYLFFGSKFGIYRTELTEDGTELVTPHLFELVAGKREGGGIGNGYEGAMVYWHSGYWYLILSPRSDYRLVCWRSKTLTSEFVDHNGETPFSDKYGWEILRSQTMDYKTPEGYYLLNTGHSGEIMMDNDGRYFVFCHASISEPNKDGYRRRAACLTEIAWNKDGWPYAVTPDKRISFVNRKPNL